MGVARKKEKSTVYIEAGITVSCAGKVLGKLLCFIKQSIDVQGFV